MHIEPGIVTGAKLALSHATAAGAGLWLLKNAAITLAHTRTGAFAARAALATAAALTFFELLPHAPVGVSEVHFILGSTLFLLFGAAPAALGLALGLLVQGLAFAPADLPQYFMNVTTLLVPLIALRALAQRIIPPATRYADIAYRQALALSATYQAGIVAWVGFWAIWGQGADVQTFAALASFSAAYLAVIVIEPLVDLAVLAAAKSLRGLDRSGLVTPRLLGA